ncbi:MAG TPA: alkaline phosphatase family protein [Solirubrobacteraceae bacterium]|nr:alkaline phosphatase family protein [Solirubrobacteraceae bacterium]
MIGTLIAALAAVLLAAASSALAAPVGGTFQVRHVYVIVLENESAAVTFGAGSPAPYLATTLTAKGAFLPNYYGVGHASLDNYIAMISGQAPNPSTRADCGVFADFPAGSLGSFGQEPGSGCVYPSNVATVAGQLDTAGLSWRDYSEDMGADPTRESATCGHPVVGQPDHTEVATPTDMYASRHNPFVYFHSIIDNAALCNSHVVNLTALPSDLARVSSTRNYTFITPNLCDDGHDATCANGQTGGLPRADAFLQTWVPKITGSPAFKRDGLLIITFDEAATSDASSCCGEIPGPAAPEPGGTGPGGGRVGAVLLSPCIKPGTVSQTAYDHYTMLGSVENIFGLSHIGYAGLPHSTYFGKDIYNRQCGPSPPEITGGGVGVNGSAGHGRVHLSVNWKVSTKGGTPLAYSELQERLHGGWHTILRHTQRTSYSFTGKAGQTYRFRVRAVNLAGQIGKWSPSSISGTASPR